VKLGRPASGARLGFVAHRTRETHDARHPVHISMKREKLAPSLRSERVYAAILTQLARLKKRAMALKVRVRVVHFSVQHDHLHLIVEGKDRQDLSAQMRTLFSRIALAVNRVAGRRGKLFRDRHHRVELTTPTQTRNALVYVLFNDRKHDIENGGVVSERSLRELDGQSSVAWITEWNESARPPPEMLEKMRARSTDVDGTTPIVAPDTWLARTGWHARGGGRLRVSELPRLFRNH